MPRRGGPVTKAGRRRSRGNALTHAITSNDRVIPEMEDQDEYDRHRQGFIDYFAPEGAVETFLVERYAALLWHTRRVTRHEVHATMVNIVSVVPDMFIAANYLADKSEGIVDPDPDELAARQHNTALPSSSEIEKIARYEAHLNRQVIQTLRQLLVLQARRTGTGPYFGPVDFRGPATA